MTTPTPNHGRDFRDRLAAIYKTAQDAQDGFARVSIHVSRQVFDEMRAMAVRSAPLAGLQTTAWGFPVIVEPDFEDDQIEVRTAMVIA